MIGIFKSAMKNVDTRKKIGFTFLMLIVIRLGSQIPVPGINAEYFKSWFEQSNSTGAFNLLSAFTGGSFERFSLFGLGITPYITASIIIQLLSIVIPALEEIQKDGEYGYQKIEKITKYLAIGLAVFEGTAMAIGFSRSGLLPNMTVLRIIIVIVSLTAGTAMLIFIGWAIDKKGIGNGISIVLLINIVAGLPKDLVTLFDLFIKGKTIAKGILAAIIIVAIIIGVVVLVVLLNEAYRRIPIQYAQKMSGHRIGQVQKSFLPIKLNTSSVIPVIFASSIFSIPQIILTLIGKQSSNFIINCLNQSNWFSKTSPAYTVGLIIYGALIYFFAYFYTSITFNPIEIADNLKKQGGTIPGIRQGKPTEEYLSKTINKVTVLGATGLLIVVLIPTFFSCVFGANVSFGGTSLIIIVGVILETLESLDAQLQSRNYRSFLG